MRNTIIAFLALFVFARSAEARPLKVICAEGVWCGIVDQLGGDAVETQNLFSRQGVDPHFQQLSAQRIRSLQGADLVVINGAHYDDWINPALRALKKNVTKVVSVAYYAPGKAQLNPHLFYSVDTTRRFAIAFSTILMQKLPQQRSALQARKEAFMKGVDQLTDLISKISARIRGHQIAESEPVADFLLADLGLTSSDGRFALAVMHHTDPSPRDVAKLGEALRSGKIKALVINPTVKSSAVDLLTDMARAAHIPIVSCPEYPPDGQLWQDWLRHQVAAFGQVLQP